MKKRSFEKYAFIFIIFILGSFIGFIHENLLTIIKGHYQLRQGLIYEPLIPIYGLGLLVFFLVYHNLNLKIYNKKSEILIAFVIGFIMGGITEYLCSYVQEKIFGTVSWDYYYLKFNFNGRTSIAHATFWGLIGLLFYELIMPILEKIKTILESNIIKILITILFIIFIIDASISIVACIRQGKRKRGIEANNYIEKLLDTYYPDKYLNKIYNNARPPRKIKQNK